MVQMCDVRYLITGERNAPLVIQGRLYKPEIARMKSAYKFGYFVLMSM